MRQGTSAEVNCGSSGRSTSVLDRSQLANANIISRQHFRNERDSSRGRDSSRRELAEVDACIGSKGGDVNRTHRPCTRRLKQQNVRAGAKNPFNDFGNITWTLPANAKRAAHNRRGPFSFSVLNQISPATCSGKRQFQRPCLSSSQPSSHSSQWVQRIRWSCSPPRRLCRGIPS